MAQIHYRITHIGFWAVDNLTCIFDLHLSIGASVNVFGALVAQLVSITLKIVALHIVDFEAANGKLSWSNKTTPGNVIE